MTVRERAILVGVNLRTVMNRPLLYRGDRVMREAIAKLEAAVDVQMREDVEGRDRALDALAKDR